jgi:pimeloyl-ACP methyl ester carboxylesterase
MSQITPQQNLEISTTVVERSGLPSIAVHSLGQDPTMLLVHGATATAASWFQAMPALAAIGAAPAAIDLRGHGQSQGFDELQSFRIRDYVTDVLDVLARWPSIRILAGHSMGGLISQLAAVQADLDKLVLVASSPVGGMYRDGIRMAL